MDTLLNVFSLWAYEAKQLEIIKRIKRYDTNLYPMALDQFTRSKNLYLMVYTILPDLINLKLVS